ncbi:MULTISPECIES: hypothetical protein [Aeromicrobium]|uniref:hypothetical protein n=1 Tax=Aeromicrobium TaxID=2040 RepID=UPI0025796FF2|nr:MULTISPECIES: hypothetical protein [Aeromicrobium]
MPRLVDVWREAWTGIGGPYSEVHRILSTRTAGARVAFTPSPRAVRSLFPAVFDRDLDPALKVPAQHRGLKYVKAFTPIGEPDARRILDAVEVQAPLLRRTAAFVTVVDPLVTAESLGVRDKREALLRLCYEWARLNDTMTPELAHALLCELDQLPSIAGVTALLRESEAVRKLEDHLEQAAATAHATSVSGGTPAGRSPTGWEALAGFLNDPDLATRFVGEAPDAPPRTLTDATLSRWDAARAIDTTALGGRAAALGLSHTSPPPPPVLRSASEASATAEELTTLHLDTSVEDRLTMALNTSRENRRGLPSVFELLEEECERAVQPLGLKDPISRTVVALGSLLAFDLDTDRDESSSAYREYVKRMPHLTRQAHTIIRRWRRARRERYATAGLPGVIARQGGDLTAPYLRLLWKRVHNHEVRRSNDYSSPDTAWSLLSGIARTLTERLDHASATAPLERPLEAHSDTPRRGSAGMAEYAAGDTVLLSIELSTIREKVGIDQETFAAFFSGFDLNDEDTRATWTRWCETAGSRLPLRAVADWLDQHAPAR